MRERACLAAMSSSCSGVPSAPSQTKLVELLTGRVEWVFLFKDLRVGFDFIQSLLRCFQCRVDVLRLATRCAEGFDSVGLGLDAW